MSNNSKSRRRGSVIARSPNTWLVRIALGTNSMTGQPLRHNKVVKGKKSDAERYLTQFLGHVDAGETPSLTKQTFGSWLDEYFDTWARDLAPRTKEKFRESVRLYTPAHMLAMRLTALTPRHFQDAYNALTVKGLSAGTISFLHRILRARLNDAVRLGRLTRNPATINVTLPRNPHSEMKTLTPDEAKRFLAAAQSDRYAGLWTLLLLTGLRPSEALGLNWEDVDGENLRVQRSLVRLSGGKWELKSTKTGRPRVVSLPHLASDALRVHRRRQAEEKLLLGEHYQDNGLVFATHLGTPLNLNTDVPRRFKPLLSRAGLPDLRLYDLRHSAATLLLAAGEHPKVVQERLGHASISLTLDTYSHVQPHMQRRAAERLDDLLKPSEAEIRSA